MAALAGALTAATTADLLAQAQLPDNARGRVYFAGLGKIVPDGFAVFGYITEAGERIGLAGIRCNDLKTLTVDESIEQMWSRVRESRPYLIEKYGITPEQLKGPVAEAVAACDPPSISSIPNKQGGPA